MWDATRKRLTVVATRNPGKSRKRPVDPYYGVHYPHHSDWRSKAANGRRPRSPAASSRENRVESATVPAAAGRTEGGLVECPVIKVSVRYLRGVRSGWKRMKNSIRRRGLPRAKHWSLRDAANVCHSAVCRQTKREKKKAQKKKITTKNKHEN
ncbi:unnamed protein product [Aphis gossypii]|uniref:Uncharacterized protein n=1 Tax=Aphis gossypii TaxID=80765 RepID=A0A9P0J422_APHGO|nr:unnamed protein product [Aphis gossypii]